VHFQLPSLLKEMYQNGLLCLRVIELKLAKFKQQLQLKQDEQINYLQ